MEQELVPPGHAENDGDDGVGYPQENQGTTLVASQKWWKRGHVALTCFLGLMFFLAATAVAYQPWVPEWPTMVVASKIYGDVGIDAGTACSSPCRYYSSGVGAIESARLLARKGVCPSVDSKAYQLSESALRLLLKEVPTFEFACDETAIPYKSDGDKLVLSSHLIAGVLRNPKFELPYISFVGLPGLLHSKEPETAALSQILMMTGKIKPRVYLPPSVSKFNLVEASAVQLMCSLNISETAISLGLGCEDKPN